jgi:hypothetical protein
MYHSGCSARSALDHKTSSKKIMSGVIYTTEEIVKVISTFSPISLDQMKDIRLMNRDDKKYIAKTSDIVELLKNASNDYYVQEINGVRIGHYETIYYDTPDNNLFLMHQDGKKNREKIRVRSYIDSSLAFCEIKKKNNHGRTSKTRIKSTDENTLNSPSIAQFIESNAIYKPYQLITSLFNNFRRITLVNKGKTERVTIDFDVVFKNPVNGFTRELRDIAIIEIKKDGNAESPIVGLLLEMRIHTSNFSKYCIGSLLVKQDIKRNNFKKDLMKIDKLTNYKYGFTF